MGERTCFITSHFIVIVSVLFILGQPREEKHPDTQVAQDVVLLDITNHKRADIANEINRISRFKSSVIGIGVVFEEEQDFWTDRKLEAAILEAGNVVLLAGLDENNEIKMPFKPFALAASNTGIEAYLMNDQNYCDRFFFLYQDSQLQLVNFAGLLASNFRHNTKTSIERYSVNSPTPLPEFKGERGFKEIDSLYSEQDVRGKIIILGILRGGDDVKIRVDGVVSEVAASVLIAFHTADLIR